MTTRRDPQKPLAGLFVGGRGRRLGNVAKGLLRVPHEETTILARLVELVRGAYLEPVFLGTCDASRAAFPDVRALLDAPGFPGPLGGLVALLRESRARGERHAFAFACDMPFLTRELLARLRNLLPSPNPGREGWKYANLLLLKSDRRLVFDEREIALNRREYDLLHYFMQRPEAVITRETLLVALDKDAEIFDRTIDSHVSHVRSRLRSAGVSSIRISSVYGVGYRLERK